MEFIYDILPENILNALGWTVLHSLWQAFLVALLLATYLLIGQQKDANKRYWASCAAMGTALLLSVITFLVLLEKNRDAAVLSPVISAIEWEVKAAYILESPKSVFTAYFDENMPLIVSVWLMGMLFFMLKTLGGLLYIQRLKTRHLTPVPAHWGVILQQFQTILGVSKKVKLVTSALVRTPMVVGWLKPIILMPVASINQLTTEQVEAILAHELAHVARYDYFINILQTIVEALFYFNPAVWWISTRIRTERENCCDDIAVATCGNSIAYAKALVALQEMQSAPPMFALAFSKNKNQLLSRIQRILKSPVKKSNVMEKITVTGLLLAAVLLLSVQANSPFNFSDREGGIVLSAPQSDMEQATPQIIKLSANDTLPNRLLVNGEGIIEIVMKNGDEIVLEMTEGVDGQPAIKSVTRNGQNVPKEDYEKYQLEKLSPEDIATVNVSKPHKKQKGNLRYHNNMNGEDIDVEMKNGKITRLKIDGEEIAEEDFPQYEQMVENMLEELPEPPVPPLPPAPATAPKAPAPPSAIPAAPAPAPPAAPRRTRTITTENNGNGMTIIIEGVDGEDPVTVEIENRNKGNVIINGNEIKGLKKGDKTVIVEEMAGPSPYLPFTWNTDNVFTFPEMDAEIAALMEKGHRFDFPLPDEEHLAHMEKLLKESEEGNRFYFKMPENEAIHLRELMKDRQFQQKELMEQLKHQQKEQMQHLRELQTEKERLLRSDQIQMEMAERMAEHRLKLDELRAQKDLYQLDEYLEKLQQMELEHERLNSSKRFHLKDKSDHRKAQ